MTRKLEIGFFIVWTAATVLISYWLGQQSYAWMPPQATLEAQKIDNLFSFLVTLGSTIFLGVFGMISHSFVTCRAQKGDFTEGHSSRGSVRLEILWTGIPILLVLWIAVQGFHIYSLLDLEGLPSLKRASDDETSAPAARLVTDANAPETIEVIVKQWAWNFHYPAQNINSSELHLQVNRQVRLALKSEDVLHGFYVPAFRIKQDIIPNHEIDFVFSPILEGKYRLNDSQFSGTYFALMEANVYVDSPTNYQKWLTQTALHPNQKSNLATDLLAPEQANPPNLWGKSWAIKIPTSTSLETAKTVTRPSHTATSENL